MEVKLIDQLSADEIRHNARQAYQHHLKITACPFEEGSINSTIWRKEFYSLERQDEDAIA